MILQALSLLAIFVILVVCEILWRKHAFHSEITRKLIHVLVGSFIAFWPFYMPLRTIQILSIALLATVAASKFFGVFRSIHNVPRRTWGEVLFPIGVFIAASLATSKWIFAAAILHMSLADGFAAIVGTKLKKTTQYKVLGHPKTILGTLTFFMLSFGITFWAILGPADFTEVTWPVLVWLPVLATILENIAFRGTDNIVIPLVVTLVLNSMQHLY